MGLSNMHSLSGRDIRKRSPREVVTLPFSYCRGFLYSTPHKRASAARTLLRCLRWQECGSPHSVYRPRPRISRAT